MTVLPTNPSDDPPTASWAELDTQGIFSGATTNEEACMMHGISDARGLGISVPININALEMFRA